MCKAAMSQLDEVLRQMLGMMRNESVASQTATYKRIKLCYLHSLAVHHLLLMLIQHLPHSQSTYVIYTLELYSFYSLAHSHDFRPRKASAGLIKMLFIFQLKHLMTNGLGNIVGLITHLLGRASNLQCHTFNSLLLALKSIPYQYHVVGGTIDCSK